MSKPIVDKAEVSIDFPDKYYHGSFSRTSSFDVKLDEQGVHIVLDRPGEERRHVAFHLHHHLFGDLLESIAEELAKDAAVPAHHRERLSEVAGRLAKVLQQ